MIYTVTFNPSLDYVIQVDDLTLGKINLTKTEDIFPGGKGVNVSVVLSNLGMENKALGFVAGFTGQQLEKMLRAYGCFSDFIPVEQGMTRINMKLNSNHKETEINARGPEITVEAINKLYEKLDEIEQGDILVLAGSIQSTLPTNIYECIMERLQEKDIKIVVDTSRECLWNVLKYRPFLIKPNHHELGDLFGVTLQSEEEIIRYAFKLQERGARNVLVSMAGNGAILVSENGQIYKSLPPDGTVVNSVGAGDSMVAGFLTGYLNTGSYEQAFKLGIVTGSATAFLPWLATKEDIVNLLDESKENFGL